MLSAKALSILARFCGSSSRRLAAVAGISTADTPENHDGEKMSADSSDSCADRLMTTFLNDPVSMLLCPCGSATHSSYTRRLVCNADLSSPLQCDSSSAKTLAMPLDDGWQRLPRDDFL